MKLVLVGSNITTSFDIINENMADILQNTRQFLVESQTHTNIYTNIYKNKKKVRTYCYEGLIFPRQKHVVNSCMRMHFLFITCIHLFFSKRKRFPMNIIEYKTPRYNNFDVCLKYDNLFRCSILNKKPFSSVGNSK